MWQCRSPRRSPTLHQRRGACPPPRPRARRGSRAAPARCSSSPAARRPPSSVAQRCVCPGGVVEHARTRRRAGPVRTAASRSAMLCSLEPVKCWSRLPNWSGATIRRSTCTPVCVRTRTPASPGAWAVSTSSSSASARASAPGSVAVAITSRSLTLSVIRRAEPASSTRSAAGCVAQRGDELLAHRERPVEHHAAAGLARTGQRSAPPGCSPRPWGRIPSASGSVAHRPPPAVRSSESIPSSSNRRRARLGPSPGRRVISTSPGGNFARSFVAAGISPSVGQGDDLLLDRRADARQLRGAAVPGQCGDRHGCVAHRLGGVAVGHDAVDDGAVELVQVAELVERGGDLSVGRIGH